MLPVLFCPECQAYLGPSHAQCVCGWERSSEESLPAPGEPIWSNHVGEAVNHAAVHGDLVIFSYGSRNGRGGVTALERSSGEGRWSCQTPHAVEGGITLAGEQLYFATLGFLGGGAELYCLGLEDGSIQWKQDLSGGAWSAPVVQEARVYVGTDDGRVQCFDRYKGDPVSHRRVSLPAGRNWLVMTDEFLLALTRSGQIMAFNPMDLRTYWPQPLETDGEITSPPTYSGGTVFFGREGGRVLGLNPRAKRLKTLAEGMKQVVAQPAAGDGVLYVGAHDHYLHALDPRSGQEIWKSEAFDHAISSAPFVCDGLVVVCVNQVGVFLLEAKTGERVWHFPADDGAKLFSDPLVDKGVIYVGTDTGQVYALPWHLGDYAWAARHLQEGNQLSRAASYHAVAAFLSRSMPQREQLYQRAEACWNRFGAPEWAARMWAGLVREKEAADAYCRAAEAQRGRDNVQAAEFYYLASRLYWRLEETSRQADVCARQAAKLGRWPDIRLKKLNTPRMTQGKPGLLSFRAENIGYGPAKNLYFSLGGSLARPVSCKVNTPLLKDSYFEISLEIVPTQPEDSLQIEAEYVEEPGRKTPFSSRLSMQIQAAPAPHKIKAGDSVWGKMKIVNPNNEPVEIELGDHVGTEVEIVLGE